MTFFSKQYRVFCKNSVLILAFIGEKLSVHTFFFILREINSTDLGAYRMLESEHSALRGLYHLILTKALGSA